MSAPWWWSTAARAPAAAPPWRRRSAPTSWWRRRSATPRAACLTAASRPTAPRSAAEGRVMASSSLDVGGSPRLSLAEKVWNINWGLVLLLTVLASVGFAMLYSAANGHWDPWAGKQIIRYVVAVVLMLGVA